MRTISFLAAALVAATAVAGQEQQRPRIYFPRHVKRQFPNVTITSSSSLESRSSSASADLSTSKTKPRAEDPASESTNPRVTTIVIQSTIFVPPASPTGSANNTGSTTSETDPSTSDKPEDPTSKPQPDDPLPVPSSDAPSDAPSPAPSSDAPSSDAPSPAPSSDAPSDVPSSGGVPPTVVLPTSRTTSIEDTTPISSEPPKPVESEDPSPSEPPLIANTTSTSRTPDAPVSVAPTTTSSTSGILLAPSGIVTTTTTSAKDPLDPVESIISNILNPPKPSNTTDPTPSEVPVTTTTTSVDNEPSIIPSLPISTPPIITTTSVGQPPVSSDKPLEPASSTPEPPKSSPTSEPQKQSSTPDPQSEPTTTTTTTGPQDPSSPPPSSNPPGPTSVSPIPSDPSSSPPVPSNTTTPTSPVQSQPPTTTEPPVSQPPVSEPVVPGNTTSANTTTIAPPQTTTSKPVTLPPTSRPTSDDVTSVPPLSTITGSQGWATPTAIIVDDASTTVSGIIAPTSGSGIPTTLPKAINPDTFDQPQPEDTTLIQIAFLNSLNYPFVSQNNQAAYQIFRLLPEALGYGSNFDLSKCRVMKLVPLDTRPSLGYLTTLAIASYPSNLVETLQMDIRLANSALYSSPNQIVQNLTAQINNAIDITLGSGYDGGPGWDTGIPSDPSDTPTDPFGGDSNPNNQTSAEKGATAGIVAGSVGIAAAYGAAMFIIARRYKRKKQAHRRASSISNPSEMQHTGRGSPALMGGALLSRDFSTYGATSGAAAGGRDSHGSGRSGMGNSGRTAYISAPVAAENSLGWN